MTLFISSFNSFLIVFGLQELNNNLVPWYYHLNLKDGLPFHPYFSIPLQLYLGYSNNSQWHRNLFWQQTFEVIFDITQFLSRIHIGIWRIWFFCFWIWMGSDLNQFSDFQTAPFPVPWLRLTSFVLMLSWLAQHAGLLSKGTPKPIQSNFEPIPRESGRMAGVRESQLLSWIWLVIVDSQSQSPPRRHI